MIMIYLLKHNTAGYGCTHSNPIAYSSSESKLWEYALKEFKAKSKFARYPWWNEGDKPLGYEIHCFNDAKSVKEIKSAKHILNLDSVTKFVTTD